MFKPGKKITDEIIRNYHECESMIEKSIPRIVVCHHEACQVMTNSDPEERIFLSYPHTNNGLLFLLTIILFQISLKKTRCIRLDAFSHDD